MDEIKNPIGKMDDEYPIRGSDVMDEIGEYLGFQMWNLRHLYDDYVIHDKEEWHFYGCDVLEFRGGPPLLVYNYRNPYGLGGPCSSDYTFNLKTMKPTKNSPKQTLLPDELIDKIKRSTLMDYLR